MSSLGTDRGAHWAHWGGFAVGLSLVVVALYAWRPATKDFAPQGADVEFTVAPTGELDVTPVGRFLSGRDLGPAGMDATGSISVRNQTGRTLAVRLRAIPTVPDLDGALNLEVSAAGQILFRGKLGGLRAWTTQSLLLRPGRGQSLTFRAWIPAGRNGYPGGLDSMSVEFQSTPVGR